MLTNTERLGRTEVRVSPGDGGRCRVRTRMTRSDPTASALRPVLLHHDALAARVSLVPDGALLLAGDVVELDVTVDAGASLALIEPGGTVAYDMRGCRARWDVRVRLGEGAVLTWAGEPFVVSAGADVERRTDVRLAASARLALRETLVLGRYGEWPGAVRQHTSVSVAGSPVLVEDLPIDRASAPDLLGGHRVLASVLVVGAGPADQLDDPDRYDLDAGGCLWRRLGAQTHRADLAAAWSRAAALSA